MTGADPGVGASAIRVLIAEDETHLGTILEQFLQARGMAVRVVRDGQSALDTLRQEAFDVALLDVVMPGLDGLEVLRQAQRLPAPPEMLIVTGNGTIETAMAALSLGAYEVVTKPYKMAQIDLLVRRAWEKRLLHRDVRRLQARLAQVEQAPVEEIGIDTVYAPLRAVVSIARDIASSPAPMCLIGEPGTGKRRLARTLHAWSPRAAAPFVELSPRRVPDVARALCGDGERSGALELVGEGTLYMPYLDEVPADAQAVLWRVLESGRLPDGQPAGYDRPMRLIVSLADGARATATVHEGLWHRVQAVSIALPPLRDRQVDLPLLANQFLAAAARRRGGSGWGLTSDALGMLERHPWPGNLHELRATLERAMWSAHDRMIGSADLTSPLVAGHANAEPTSGASLAEMERAQIAAALQATGWHQGRAAARLGISAKTLYRKIREYGFLRPRGGAGRTTR